jgi:hypothetical protein
MNLAASAPYWIRRLITTLVACPIALSPSAAVAATFGEVMGWCSAPRIEGDEKLCDGYVRAALTLLRTPDPVLNGGHRVCPPERVSLRTVVPILVTWDRQHPDARSEEAVTTIGDALVGHYPCT